LFVGGAVQLAQCSNCGTSFIPRDHEAEQEASKKHRWPRGLIYLYEPITIIAILVVALVVAWLSGAFK
jgi:hypothetical protein